MVNKSNSKSTEAPDVRRNAPSAVDRKTWQPPELRKSKVTHITQAASNTTHDAGGQHS